MILARPHEFIYNLSNKKMMLSSNFVLYFLGKLLTSVFDADAFFLQMLEYI